MHEILDPVKYQKESVDIQLRPLMVPPVIQLSMHPIKL